MDELILYLLFEKNKIEELKNLFNNFKNVKSLNDELMYLPYDFSGDIENIIDDDYEWIAVDGFSEILEFGLSNSHAFSCYFSVEHIKFNHLILSFTHDGYIILGLTITDTDENMEYLKENILTLKEQLNATLCGIFTDNIPVYSKLLFEICILPDAAIIAPSPFPS